MIKLLITAGLSSLAIACASTSNLELGRDKNAAIDGASFSTELPGKVRIELHPQDDKFRCTAQTEMPHLVVSADNAQYVGKPMCSADGGRVLVDFPLTVKPGSYSVDMKSGGSLGSHVNGVVLFAPTEPEKKSGANQTFQGASELKMGVNEGDLTPALGNRTDWWRIEVPTLTPVSMVFQDETDPNEVSATVSRSRFGRMSPVTSLSVGKPKTIQMEGSYYVSVQGAHFGKSTKYSLSLSKMDSAAASAVKNQMTQNIAITDMWLTSPSRTELVLAIGKDSGIAVGDTIKIMKGSALVEGCKVEGVSDNESQCVIERALAGNHNEYRGRRNL